MTVQNCSGQMDLNREALNPQRKMQNYLSQGQATVPSSANYQIWKASERTIQDKLKGQSELNCHFSGQISPQRDQEEALNMSTEGTRNKPALSAFREISAMESMKNAVQQLQEKFQTSAAPFPINNQNLCADVRKSESKFCS